MNNILCKAEIENWKVANDWGTVEIAELSRNVRKFLHLLSSYVFRYHLESKLVDLRVSNLGNLKGNSWEEVLGMLKRRSVDTSQH